MAKIERFEDLNTWIEARKLFQIINKICQKPQLKKEFYIVSQIKSSTISIMANIAEGFGRYGLKDSKQFYIIARGSVAETQSHLYVLKDAGFIEQGEFDETYSQTVFVNKLINGLIKATLKNINASTHERINT